MTKKPECRIVNHEIFGPVRINSKSIKFLDDKPHAKGWQVCFFAKFICEDGTKTHDVFFGAAANRDLAIEDAFAD